MPELPEVEIICRQLATVLPGERITGVEVRLAKAWQDPERLTAVLSESPVREVRRRGKYLLLATARATLVVHLRMTGALLYYPTAEFPDSAHVRVVLTLAGGGRLVFRDVRTFGGITLLSPASAAVWETRANLGPEPFSAAWSGEYLYNATRGRKTKLKSFLLDQSKVAGIGNIYADEALFQAGLRPRRAAERLTRPQAARLAAAVREVMAASIARGGTSFRDYRDSAGKRGEYVAELQVYGRGGKPCRRCGQILRKIRLGGRATVYCPHCQK